MVAVLVGCQSPEACPPAIGASALSSLSKEDQVRLVVFTHLLAEVQDLYQKPNPSRLNAFYLSVGKREASADPSDGLMNAIGVWKYPVKKASRCTKEFGDRGGRCLDKDTHQPGFILWVGEIKWIDAATAEIKAGQWEHAIGASGEGMRVRFKDGRWQIDPSFAGDIWNS
jgi:hypothetical protein